MKSIKIIILLIISFFMSVKTFAVAPYELSCVIKNGCQHAEEGNLGYCVSGVTLNNKKAIVSIKEAQSPTVLFPIEFEIIIEKVQDGEVAYITGTDDIFYFGDSGELFAIGDNHILLEKGEAENGQFIGSLTLEEDFAFDVTCKDLLQD